MDEKKYLKCVDDLDQREKWTQEIHFSAGLCSADADDEILPQIQAHPRPT